MREFAETCRRILWHRLNLQREDAQFVHHPGHAVGHHAEIFGADEHTGGLCQFGQFLHSLRVPELVVTTVEVVVVETVEDELVVVPQCLIDEVVLYTDAWVELILILTVAHEEHIADQGIETVAEVG